MKALRLQPSAAGNLANLPAFAIAVAAGLELTARTLLTLGGMNEVKVVCLPWLADGRWYLFADPAKAPVVGRLVLPGTKAPITVGPVPNPRNYDGVLLKATADLGVVACGRIGVVRGGT